MKTFIIYQYEVAICLTAFSALYFLLWRKETNFQFRRFLLLSIPVLSMVIPLLDFTISFDVSQPTVEYLAYIPNTFAPITQATQMAPANTISVWVILSSLWIVGACLMLIRFMISLWKIWNIYRNAETSTEGRYKIVKDPIRSFSFFKMVAINKNQLNTMARDHILAHEFAHSKQHHSIDVVLIEVIKIIQWFNPMSWVLAHTIKQNLEFLADQLATLTGRNVQGYQYAIVHHANDPGYQMLKSQFSKSNLKQRILMMNQPNNQKIRFWKLNLLIPILAFLLMSFSVKIENLNLKNELKEALPILNLDIQDSEDPRLPSSISVQPFLSVPDIGSTFDESDSLYASGKVYNITDEHPYPSSGDMESYLALLRSDLKYKDEVLAKDKYATVYMEMIVQKDGKLRDVKVLKGIEPKYDDEVLRSFKEGPDWNAGKVQGEKVDTRLAIAFRYASAVNSSSTGSTSVKVGYPVYVENKTNRGVVENRISFDGPRLLGTVKDEEGNPVIGCNVIIKGTTTGTVTDKEGRFAIVTDPSHEALIFSYVGMLTQTIPISEEKEYNITMKEDNEYQGKMPMKFGFAHGLSTRSENDHDSIASVMIKGDKGQPMFFIDGVEQEVDALGKLNPSDIESINVVKGSSAFDKFGSKGENGVVLITTKSGNESVDDIIKKEKTNEGGTNSNIIKNIVKDPKNPPLFILDGKELSEDEITDIEPNNIESISVLKDRSATEIYGEKGKNGVVIIKTKK